MIRLLASAIFGVGLLVGVFVAWVTTADADDPNTPTIEIVGPYHITAGEQITIHVEDCPVNAQQGAASWCVIFAESPEGSGATWATNVNTTDTTVSFTPNPANCGIWPREGLWPVRLFNLYEYWQAGYDDTLTDAKATALFWVSCPP